MNVSQSRSGGGGSNIGTGQVPVPGEQGFSGNAQQQGQQQSSPQQAQANVEQSPTVGSVQ